MEDINLVEKSRGKRVDINRFNKLSKCVYMISSSIFQVVFETLTFDL